jgi:TRAP-type C4-dicarboxylate transport system substrate-binding protein
MKKLSLIIMVLALIAGLILSGCGTSSPSVPATSAIPTSPTSPAAAGAPIKLLFGSFDSDQGPYAALYKAWAQELEQRSNGRVKVEFSWSSALGPMPAFYDILTSGVCDIAGIMPAMRPGLTPITDVVGLPFTNHSALQATKAFYKLYQAGYLDKEYADVKVCYFYAGRPTALVFNKTVTNLTEMKGTKIHAGSDIQSTVLTTMGASPVNIPPMDLASSLQKKVIDGSTSEWTMLKPLQMWDYVNYYVPGFGGFAQAVAMNKDKYNQLPKDIQTIIDDMFIKYGELQGQATDSGSDEVIAQFKAKGGTVSSWSQADLAALDTTFKPIWDKYISDREANGLPVTKAINIYYQALIDQGVTDPAMGYKPSGN